MTLTELKYIVAVARKSTLAVLPKPATSPSPRCPWPSRSWKKSWMSRFLSAVLGKLSVTSLGEEIVRQAQSVLEQAEGDQRNCQAW